MRKGMLVLAVAVVFSLSACKEELCEAGDERCEVGDGKCVVGYDDNCEWGQVCYAGEGAPKGKRGTCTDGEFDAEGKLVATVLSSGPIQGDQIIGAHRSAERPGVPDCPWRPRECFSDCIFVDYGPTAPDWIGRGAATLTVSVQGPHAETAQLKAAVRGVDHEGCEKNGSASKGRQQWTCHFPEGWAGENTTESLAINLWTENIPSCPWGVRFLVDTKPLELNLEAQVKEGFLEASLSKPGVVGWQWELGWPWGTTDGAWLQEVSYSSLKIFKNDSEISIPWEPVTRVYGFGGEWPPPQGADPRVQLPAGLTPGDTLEIRATVSAKDLAGNEVTEEKLTTTLKL